jgi:fluoride exporter
MNQFLLVGLGGAVGSILRFVIQRQYNSTNFPYGTIAVNIAGCFVIGLIWALFTKGSIGSTARLLLLTGFCGGFTTFSAFTQEGLLLLQQSRWGLFFIYTLASVAAGLLATFAGYKLIT